MFQKEYCTYIRRYKLSPEHMKDSNHKNYEIDYV